MQGIILLPAFMNAMQLFVLAQEGDGFLHKASSRRDEQAAVLAHHWVNLFFFLFSKRIAVFLLKMPL